MSDSYRPRPDDHLVEPMFAGLGVEEGTAAETQSRRSRGRSVLLVTVLVAAAALVWWLISGE